MLPKTAINKSAKLCTFALLEITVELTTITVPLTIPKFQPIPNKHRAIIISKSEFVQKLE